jgi:hypothetical protein
VLGLLHEEGSLTEVRSPLLPKLSFSIWSYRAFRLLEPSARPQPRSVAVTATVAVDATARGDDEMLSPASRKRKSTGGAHGSRKRRGADSGDGVAAVAEGAAAPSSCHTVGGTADADVVWKPSWDTYFALAREAGLRSLSAVASTDTVAQRVVAAVHACEGWLSRATAFISTDAALRALAEALRVAKKCKPRGSVVLAPQPGSHAAAAAQAEELLAAAAALPARIQDKEDAKPGDPAATVALLRNIACAR